MAPEFERGDINVPSDRRLAPLLTHGRRVIDLIWWRKPKRYSSDHSPIRFYPLPDPEIRHGQSTD